jgi:hypothetical protein
MHWTCRWLPCSIYLWKTIVALGNCGEKIECVYYAFASRGRDVHVLTSIMMHGWAQGIAMLSVRCPSSSFCWFLVRHNNASLRCKRCFIVINEATEVSCSEQLWVQSRGSQKIQSNLRFGAKVRPTNIMERLDQQRRALPKSVI